MYAHKPGAAGLWLVTVAALFGLSACGDYLPPTAPDAHLQAKIEVPPDVPPGPPSDAGKPVGNIQITEPGPGDVTPEEVLTVAVLVTDKKGIPLADRPVSFSSTNGGSFDQANTSTGIDGTATAQFTAGTAAGTEHIITATSGTRSDQVTLTVIAGAATTITKVSDPAAPVMVGETITVSVRVTDDDGNPVQGHEVEWLVTDGYVNGNLNSQGEFIPTGADGIASIDWTLGESPGSMMATARDVALSGSPVQFMVQAEPGPPASIELVLLGGSTMSGNPGSSLDVQAEVFDQFGNLIPGQQVSWSSSDPTNVAVSPESGAFTTASVQELITENISVTITASFDGISQTVDISIEGVEPPSGQ